MDNIPSNPPLHLIHRSAAEFLACAFLDLFPGAYLIDGDTTEFGFYYDFIAQQPIDPQALPMLEEKMRGLAKQDIEIRILDMMRENAAKLFEHKEQLFKADQIRGARENIVQVLQIGDFYDYSRSLSSLEIKPVLDSKLLEVERTTRYFPEEEEIEVVRIYGVASHDKAALKKAVKIYTAGKKRNHQVLGEKLKLFTFNNISTKQTPTWLPKGVLLRDRLINWCKREYEEQNFQLVSSPLLIKKELTKKIYLESGIEEESISSLIEDVEYVIPMTFIPSHIQLFKAESHSCNDQPIRYAECGQLAQKSRNHSLWGLLNIPLAHVEEVSIFCNSKDLEKELISFLQFIDKTAKMFNLGCHWILYPRGKPLTSPPAGWNDGLNSFSKAFEACSIEWKAELGNTRSTYLTAEAHLIDGIGREWKGPRIGIAFTLPEKLGLRFQEGNVPAMLTGSLFGSFERFIAILIENDAGKLPL